MYYSPRFKFHSNYLARFDNQDKNILTTPFHFTLRKVSVSVTMVDNFEEISSAKLLNNLFSVGLFFGQRVWIKWVHQKRFVSNTTLRGTSLLLNIGENLTPPSINTNSFCLNNFIKQDNGLSCPKIMDYSINLELKNFHFLLNKR